MDDRSGVRRILNTHNPRVERQLIARRINRRYPSLGTTSFMGNPSITSIETFRLHIQRSETLRGWLMVGVYLTLIGITCTRRALGGLVMKVNEIFFLTLAVLAAGAVYQAFTAVALARSTSASRLVPLWRLNATILLEIAVPALLMLWLHHWSPRGQYAALSAPVLLLFPLSVLVSILRLRPQATLFIGLAAGITHASLTLDTWRTGHVPEGNLPLLLTYAVLLTLTGVAGMVVASAARRYVVQAVEDAQAHERVSLRIAAIERDLEVARQIQMGLLPAAPPAFDGYSFAGMNRPAEQTGGDYFDWQPLPDGRLMVVMADVTGHGIGPALVMAVCRAYARATAPLDSDPASLMSRLNTLLADDVKDGRFVTLAMAVLHTSGRVELVSAGHGPTLLYRAETGVVEQFGGDGLPLAVMPGEDYGPSRSFAMQPGDVLVLLTDGIPEWPNDSGVQLGSKRLAEALARAATQSPENILAALDRIAKEHADGAPQLDDVTIVVVKRVPPR